MEKAGNLEETEEEQKEVKDRIKKLESQAAKYESRIQILKDEINSYEELGKEASDHMRKRIDEARKDIASFIADLSVYSSVNENNGASSYALRVWTFQSGMDYLKDNSEMVEECSTWQEVLQLLEDNLVYAGVGKEYRSLTASVLYSAYHTELPILLIGPNAEELVHALSLAVCGKLASVLDCSGEYKASVLEELSHTNDEIVIVRSPLQQDWVLEQTKMDRSSRKHFFGVHPYIEDLYIEPKGLYNYVLPLFTEPLVDNRSMVGKMWAGKEKEDFSHYDQRKTPSVKLPHMSSIGLSKLTVAMLKSVIGTAKTVSEKLDSWDLEYLFGVLPFAVLMQRNDILADVVDDFDGISEKRGVSGFLKTEFQRYCQDE